MASSETSSANKVKLPVVMLLIVVMLGSLLGVAGAGAGVYFLLKSGKLAMGSIASAGSTMPATEASSQAIVMEPILANLADQGGHAYLRLGLTLDVDGTAAKGDAASDAKTSKAPTEQELAARDTVLAVLGQQTSAWLLGPDGKEHLKIELKEALAKHNADLKVKDIFFTDFLVQI